MVNGDIKYIIYTDGGARGNPGPAGIGGVIMDEDEHIITRFAEYIGETTNNQAEYKALITALEIAKEEGIKYVTCFLDSELVVKQLNKEYKVRDEDLAKLYIRIWNSSQSFKRIEYKHVRRQANKLADKLVNQALDEQEQK